MIWKEKGVEKGSHMCFFNPSDTFKEYYYYLVSCGYFQCNSQYSYKSNGNRPPLLCYIIGGSLDLDYEQQHFRASSNDILLINCQKPHHYYCTETCEFIFFHFNCHLIPNLTEHLISQNGSPLFTLDNALNIYNNINEPIMKLCYQEQTTDASLSSMVYSTLCMLQADKETLPNPTSASSDITVKAIQYINNHISEKLTLQTLANYVNLSAFYFSRIFKKETGYSPIEYVSMMKINYAKLMLRTTNASITSIADSLGYSSTSSFINAFIARRGLSPKKYRELADKKNSDCQKD